MRNLKYMMRNMTAVQIPEVIMCMGGTFQATVGFQDSDFFQNAVKMVWRCTFSVISYLSGFKL